MHTTEVEKACATHASMRRAQAWAEAGAPAGCMAKKGLRKGMHVGLRAVGQRAKREAKRRVATKPAVRKGERQRARVSVCERQVAALKEVKAGKANVQVCGGDAEEVEPPKKAAKKATEKERLVESLVKAQRAVTRKLPVETLWAGPCGSDSLSPSRLNSVSEDLSYCVFCFFPPCFPEYLVVQMKI